MVRVVVALAAAVVVGAAAMPVTSVGIGWLISALAALGVAVTARTLRGRLVALSSAPDTPGPTAAAGMTAAAGTTAPAGLPGSASAPSGAPAVSSGSTATVSAPAAASAPGSPESSTAPAATTPPAGPGTAEATARSAPGTAAPPDTPAAAPSAAPPEGPAAPGAAASPTGTATPGPVAPGTGPLGPELGRPRPEWTPPTRGDRIWRWAAGAAALVFVAVPAVRASNVLLVLCLFASLLLASYALVGGRTWAWVLFSGFMLLVGVVAGIVWMATHRASQRSGVSGKSLARVGGAVVVTVVLVLILVPLLRSADPVFANLLDSWVRHLPRLEFRSAVGAVVVAGLSLAAAYYAYRGAFPNRVREEGRTARAGLEWLLPVAVVDLIFAVFVVVQVNVLFGGHDYVLGVGGPDYADYARSGFGQLCLVTLISLALAAGLGGLIRRQTRRQRVLIRLMGGLLCLLTLVIVASALKRMLLYVDVYGFTWLRILSFSFEVFLGLVFVLLLIAGIRLRGAWLPRATAAVGVGVLFALVAVNPEAVMARTTIDARLEQGRAVDLAFLDGLSADAVDELVRLPEAQRACVLKWLRDELAEPDAWYQFNLAREHARAVLAGVPRTLCAHDMPRS